MFTRINCYCSKLQNLNHGKQIKVFRNHSFLLSYSSLVQYSTQIAYVRWGNIGSV